MPRESNKENCLLNMKFFAILALIVFFSQASFSQNSHQKFHSEPYQQNLIQKSKDLDLANDQDWLHMLYYQKNIFGGQTSIIDSPNFFLSPNGKTDPKKELESTITALFNQKQCDFKGRYEWLKEKLNFDDKKLLPQE
ncbi:MAG: hypothetical protein ACJAZX_000765 [Rickettsiales bacterium]|jgi:hypothetical protein